MDGNCRYVFADIPNDDEGRAFIESLKKYQNKGRYKMLVKGQYMNEEAKKDWRKYSYGAPKSMCTHLRVYFHDAPKFQELEREHRREREKRERSPIATARRLQREAEHLWLTLVDEEAKQNDCS
tara:strand:- start:421 stop:792 length:372 start_codon:yes stop_codon:yes gene_type:complete